MKNTTTIASSPAPAVTPTVAPSIELESADFQIIKNSHGWYRWLGKGRFAAYASSEMFATPADVCNSAIAFLDEIDEANSSELEDDFGFES